MSELAGLFPTLARASGVKPWKASQFVRWAILHGHCSGSAHAVRFLLSVWNPASDWREILKEAKASHEDQTLYQTMLQLRKEAAADLSETLQRTPTEAQIQKDVEERLELFRPFNLSDAVAVWDAKHRAALTAWISDPFWP
jgi:hypothetical protein